MFCFDLRRIKSFEYVTVFIQSLRRRLGPNGLRLQGKN